MIDSDDDLRARAKAALATLGTTAMREHVVHLVEMRRSSPRRVDVDILTGTFIVTVPHAEVDETRAMLAEEMPSGVGYRVEGC